MVESFRKKSLKITATSLPLDISLKIALGKMQNSKSNIISEHFFNLWEHKNKIFISSVSNAVISFSKLSEKNILADIYISKNNYSFQELDAEFKRIMLLEFEDAICKFIEKKS